MADLVTLDRQSSASRWHLWLFLRTDPLPAVTRHDKQMKAGLGGSGGTPAPHFHRTPSAMGRTSRTSGRPVADWPRSRCRCPGGAVPAAFPAPGPAAPAVPQVAEPGRPSRSAGTGPWGSSTPRWPACHSGAHRHPKGRNKILPRTPPPALLSSPCPTREGPRSSTPMSRGSPRRPHQRAPHAVRRGGATPTPVPSAAGRGATGAESSTANSLVFSPLA